MQTTIVRRAVYILCLMLAFVVRWIALQQYAGHIDEPASLIAVSRVAELGYPQFPSGVLYLQGAVFSYVAAPLSWFFHGTQLFDASRILYLLLTLTIVPLTIKLTHLLSQSGVAMLAAGVLVACDPTLITWSITIRPYGLLAAEVLAFLVLVSLLFRDGPEAQVSGIRIALLLPLLVLLGTFTHIGFWLIVPAIVFAGVWRWNRALLGSARSLLIAGAVSLVPLIAFLGLGKSVGAGAGTSTSAVGESFVGSHLFSLQRFLDGPHINWSIWTGNFLTGGFSQTLPLLIAAGSGVLLVTSLTQRDANGYAWRSDMTLTLLLVHWSVIVAVTILVTTDPDPRYLVLMVPVGYILVVLTAHRLWQLVEDHSAAAQVVFRGVIILILVVPMFVYGLTGSQWRLTTPGGKPDYWQATAWAAGHKEPGQLVVSALPTSAYFWFGEDEYDDLIFLAGPAGGQRAERYIKPNLEGIPGDYWLGVASIGSKDALCRTLTDNAGRVLIVVDIGRLNAPWALQGEFQRIILGSSLEVHREANGALVLATIPYENWNADAQSLCSG